MPDLRTVHLLISTLRTGDATSQHTFDLVRLLAARGADVRIFHNYSNGPLPDDIRPLVTWTNYASYTPGADLTILQYPVWFPLAERFRDASAAAIFWYHGVTPPRLWGRHPGLDILQTSEVRTELAWHAHVAVCASPFTAAELHSHAGYPKERIRVVPLMLDIASLSKPPDAGELEAVRRKWQLADHRIVLYIGRLAGNKRIDLLIQALAKLERPDVRLVVVGDTSLTESMRSLHAELTHLAQTLGVADQVIFTGRVPSVTPYLHLADLLVLPSQHEGFGVPVAEAMAAGTPVIASAGGALPWVLGAQGPSSLKSPEVDKQAAGLLFAPGDVDALAAQIGRVLDDSDLAAALAERGRSRVQAFSPEQFNSNVNQVIDEALALAAQAPPPAATAQRPPLAAHADIVMREYTVRSRLPIVGRVIEWVRRNSTSHLKEPYLDRMLERQVNYNHRVAAQLAQLQHEVEQLRAEIAALRKDAGQKPPTS